MLTWLVLVRAPFNAARFGVAIQRFRSGCRTANAWRNKSAYVKHRDVRPRADGCGQANERKRQTLRALGDALMILTDRARRSDEKSGVTAYFCLPPPSAPAGQQHETGDQ
jgi:hypothetical protein